jgi:hypothetical protein
MEKITKKPTFHKIPNTTGGSDIIESKSMMDTVSKWIPLICAGGAIGISIFALKEIKNTRKELISFKKESLNPDTEKLEKKMENLEQELKSISDYLKNSSKQRNYVENIKKSRKTQQPEIVKNTIKQEIPEEVRIINESNEDQDEYEEVEVTDDEEEEN